MFPVIVHTALPAISRVAIAGPRRTAQISIETGQSVRSTPAPPDCGRETDPDSMPPMRKARLDPSERAAFDLLARAAFANPFGRERAELDLQIAESAGPLKRDRRIELLLQKLESWLGKLERTGRIDLDAFAPSDRSTVEAVFLFDAYYQLAAPFDDLIRRQLSAGADSCPVPFASAALAKLRQRGFTPDEARQHFAMLFQLRRAYFFIQHGLVGKSECMRELRRQLWNAVVTHDLVRYARLLLHRMEEFSTLLLGETGTGKGAAALAMGNAAFIPFDEKKGRFQESFTRVFLSINLSRFPEGLIESELFGHKKGAFTGAVEDHGGLLALSSPHGAVFLDEIGEVSIPIQIKLLQVLQERVYSPVGSHEKLRFRGRIVAATNRSLATLRELGTFRDDFFYRISSTIIHLPPLRQRIAEEPEELKELLRHTLRRLTGAETPALVEEIERVLRRDLPASYPWPGNVRELEQCVRSVLLTDSYRCELHAAEPRHRERLLHGIESGSLDAQGLLESYCALLHDRSGSLAEVARRTKLDRRTVRKHLRARNSKR